MLAFRWRVVVGGESVSVSGLASLSSWSAAGLVLLVSLAAVPLASRE